MARGRATYYSPEVSSSVTEQMSLVLRRYPIQHLLGGHNRVVTLIFVFVIACIGMTFTRLGVIHTLAWSFITAVLFVGCFMRLRGNVKRPRPAKLMAQQWMNAFSRNLINPIMEWVMNHTFKAFIAASVIAELSKMIDDDAITITLMLIAASVFLTCRNQPQLLAHCIDSGISAGRKLRLLPWRPQQK